MSNRPPMPRGASPFERLVDLMATLRSEAGCPWDREQTHVTLTPYLIEEAYEALECIEEGNLVGLREELGDVLLQIVFHAQIAQEAGVFDINDVAAGIVDKMVRRHPHVFGERVAETPDAVLRQWEEIKLEEKARKHIDRPRPSEHDDVPPTVPFVSLMEGIPRQMPALLAADRITGRAAEVGFEWDDATGAVLKVSEECREAVEAFESGDVARVREEMGDVLFAVANACRMMGVISEDALRQANAKFIDRFHHIEREAARRGTSVAALGTPEQLLLWEESKTQERTPERPSAP